MGTITIDPLVDGTFVSTSDLNADFRKLSEINGKLDSVNVTLINQLLDYTYIQLGAVSGGVMVGGTANLDYFNNVRYFFQRGQEHNLWMQDSNRAYLTALDADTTIGDIRNEVAPISGTQQRTGKQNRTSEFPGVTDAATADAALPRAIPGASTSFYLPYQAHVLVTWQVTWTSDAARFGPTPTAGDQGNKAIDPSRFPQPNVAIRFFFDGAEHANASTTRESREAMFAQQIDRDLSGAYNEYDDNALPTHKLRDRHKSRYWSGHAYIGTKAKGFHTASLRVISQEIVRQTRVRARNIKVLYFKA